MLYRAAVIGDSQTVMGFKAVGLTTVAVSEEKEAARQLDKLAEAGYAVIYITEQLAALIPQDIDRYNDEPTVAVIPIPSQKGSLGIGLKGLHQAWSEPWEPTSSKNSDPVFRGVTVSWQERPACKRKKVAD